MSFHVSSFSFLFFPFLFKCTITLFFSSNFLVRLRQKDSCNLFASGKKVVVVVLLRGRFSGCIDDVNRLMQKGGKKSRGCFEPANVFFVSAKSRMDACPFSIFPSFCACERRYVALKSFCGASAPGSQSWFVVFFLRKVLLDFLGSSLSFQCSDTVNPKDRT